MRKILACFVSVSLLLSGPGMPYWAYAADGEPEKRVVRVDADAARILFQENGVFQDEGGKADNLRGLFFDEKGKISDVGEIFYQFLLAGGDADVAAADKLINRAPGQEGMVADKDAIQRRLEEIKDSLDALRKLGEATPEMRKAAANTIQATRERYFGKKFDELSGNISKGQAEPLKLRALLGSVYDGAASAAKQKDPDYVRVDTADGFTYYDEKGEAIRQAKNMVCRKNDAEDGTEPLVMSVGRFNTFKTGRQAAGDYGNWRCGVGSGATIYSRALREQQEKMNDPAVKPACAPEIPLTGRYNYEMLLYSSCKLENQAKQLDLDYRVKRMQNIDQMIGGQHQQDQYVDDELYNNRLMTNLEKKAADKSIKDYTEKDATCPGTESVLTYVDCKYEQTRQRLDKAKASVAAYKSRVERFKNREIITNAEIESLQNDEKLGSKRILSSYLEIAKHQVTNQLEMISYEVKFAKDAAGGKAFDSVSKSGGKGGSWLTEWEWKRPTWLGGRGVLPVQWKTYESPDSKYLRENLEDAPWAAETKEAYLNHRDKLAHRLGRLRLVLDRLDEDLEAADHMTGLAPVQAVLGATQSELNDVSMDLSMFATLPALAKVAHDEARGWTNWWTHMGHKAVNWTSRTIFDGTWGADYLKHRQTLDTYLPAFEKMSAMLAHGNFEGARKALIALDPSALSKTWSAPVFGNGSPETTDGMRVQAALQKVQKSIAYVADRNLLAGSIVNTLTWSVALGAFAPMVSVAARGLSTTAAGIGSKMIEVTGKAGYVMKPIGYTLRGVGAILEHFALRLQSLSPASDRLYANNWALRKVEAFGIRSANAGLRIGSFGALAGTVSAGFGGAMYGWNQIVGDGDSPMPSLGGAMWTSFKHGSSWASKSWHPLILFAGLPANAFDGVPVMGSAAQSVAHRGVLGNFGAAVRSTGAGIGRGITWVSRGKITFETAARLTGRVLETPGISHVVAGGKWLMSQPLVVMADHIGKFVVVSQGAGAAGRYFTTNYNTVDETNIERRLKRAEQSAAANMEAPWWLLLPVAAAKTEMQATEQQRTMQGVKEYLEAGEGYRLTNMVPEVTELPLKTTVKVPLMQRFFNASIRGEKAGGKGTFKISADMLRSVIRQVLPGEIDLAMGYKAAGKAGAKGAAAAKGAKAPKKLELTPLAERHLVKLYEISQQKHTRLGRMEVTDHVIDQASELFTYQVGKSAKLRRAILSIDAKNLGKPVPGFGIVDPAIQKEFARIASNNANNAAFKLKATELTAAKKILGAEYSTEVMVANASDDMYQAHLGLKNPSKPFVEMMSSWLDDITAWKDQNPRLMKKYGDDYMSIVRDLQAKAKQLKLPENELLAVDKTATYIQTVRDRFQYFNKIGTAHGRAQIYLTSRMNQVKSQPGMYGTEVEQVLTKMQGRLTKWKQIHVQKNSLDATAQILGKKDAPGEITFNSILKDMGDDIANLKGKVKAPELKFLNDSVAELKTSPFILQSAKGGPLPDWRPVQFEGLTYFLSSVMTKGTEAATTVRTFLMMKTGAGKTFLAYEGLLPYAESVAKHRGLKTIFLTVQSNLEAQARTDFRALNKVRSTLEFDTWEGFKSKIAQGKLDFKMKPEEYFILGDEMDGAALQPALTIGETTARVSRWSVGYDKLKPTYTRLQEVLTRGSTRLQGSLESGLVHRQTLVKRIPKGTAQEALASQVDDMLALSRKLAQLENKTYVPASQRSDILAQARAALKRILGRGQTVARGGRPPSMPQYRVKANIEAINAKLLLQRSLMQNPEVQLAANQKLLGQQLKDAWEVLGWKGKTGTGSTLVEQTLKALGKKMDMLYTAGDSAQALRVQGQMVNLQHVFESIKGLKQQAVVYAQEVKKGGKGFAEVRAEIAKLEGQLKSVQLAGKQSAALAQVKEPPLGQQVKETVAALRSEAQSLRQAGKTQNAAKLEAKANTLAEMHSAVERLEKTPNGTALRREARQYVRRADLLETQGGAQNIKEARTLRTKAQTLEQQALVKDQSAAEAGQQIQSKLKKVFIDDLAFERQAITNKIKSGLERQSQQAAKLDKEVAKDFKSSDAEIQDILQRRKEIVGIDRDNAISLHKDMMKTERSVLAQTDPRGTKIVKDLRNMAKQARKDGAAAAKTLRQQGKTVEAERTLRESGLRAERIEAQAQRTLADGKTAREALKANSKQIDQVLKDGGEGWEVRARELLKRREQLVERAVEKENPVYEIFREMRDSMYSHVYSKTRTTQLFQTLEHSPRAARHTMSENASAPRKHAKALVKKLKEMKADGKGGNSIDSRIRKAEAVLEKLNQNTRNMAAEHRKMQRFETEALEARHKSLMETGTKQQEVVDKAYDTLRAAEQDMQLKPGSKVLKARLKDAQEGLKSANKELLNINSQMREFNTGRHTRMDAKLDGYKAGAEKLAKDVRADLAQLAEGWDQVGNVRSQVTAINRELSNGARRWQTEKLRLKMTPEKAETILRQRMDGVSVPEMAWTHLRASPLLAISKLANLPGLSRAPPVQNLGAWADAKWEGIVGPKEGLTRYYSRRLLKAFLNEPLITPQVRWRMFWKILPDVLFSKGIGYGNLRTQSFVQGELFNLANGYVENSRTIRMDHVNDAVNVVHNGQWFESMDTPTRRFWELEYGADLTLPYDSQTIATIRDVTQNTKVRFIGFSGTAGKEFRASVEPYKSSLVGVGSTGAENLQLEIHASPSGKMKSITQGLRRNMLHDFQMIDAGGQADSLLVLSLADTRVVKQVQKILTRNGVSFTSSEVSPRVLRSLMSSGYDVSLKNGSYTVKLKQGHITKVFSDAELLRTQMPKARVGDQMNLDALTPGTAKVLILDTRVGGRGLDLNFKGQRGKGPFGGYKRFEMQLHDPQVASEAHFLQAQGRIDVGRVKEGSIRNFRVVMDVPSSSKEVVFLKMLRDEPLMTQLRQRPEVVQNANRRGNIHPEWVDIHNYIESLKEKVRFAETRGPLDNVTRGHKKMIDNYNRTVERNLDAQKLEVEKDQLRSASVLQDQAMFNWLMRGMHPSTH
ncbi:MAG: hypothetical protein ABIJ96_03400 [Elusimicrobiota bacterium]